MFNLKTAGLAVAAIFVAGTAHAACDAAALIEQCSGKLDAGFIAMNTYTLASEAGKTMALEDDNVLSSRMTYQVVICGPAADQTEFALETGSRKPVLSNKSGDTMQPMLTFTPERMSVYYLMFKGPEGAEMCGAAVVGVMKKQP